MYIVVDSFAQARENIRAGLGHLTRIRSDLPPIDDLTEAILRGERAVVWGLIAAVMRAYPDAVASKQPRWVNW